MSLFLTEAEVDAAAMAAAVEVLEAAFREQGAGRATNRPRQRVHAPQGCCTLMRRRCRRKTRWIQGVYDDRGAGALPLLAYDLQTGRCWR